MKIKELLETATAGATSAGMGATLIKGGSGPAVGTLFGGSYKQNNTAKRKRKSPSESIIRR
jgi:hypothetical protein